MELLPLPKFKALKEFILTEPQKRIFVHPKLLLEMANREPTFDASGHPTQETLATIEVWEYPWLGLMDFFKKSWRHDYGRIWCENERLHIATGGWSANEELVSALRRNNVFWAMHWESSHRGGLEILKIQNEKETFIETSVET